MANTMFPDAPRLYLCSDTLLVYGGSALFAVAIPYNPAAAAMGPIERLEPNSLACSTAVVPIGVLPNAGLISSAMGLAPAPYVAAIAPNPTAPTPSPAITLLDTVGLASLIAPLPKLNAPFKLSSPHTLPSLPILGNTLAAASATFIPISNYL